jgi:hypothetical protein
VADQRDDVGRTIFQSEIVAGKPKILLAIVYFLIFAMMVIFKVHHRYSEKEHRAARLGA